MTFFQYLNISKRYLTCISLLICFSISINYSIGQLDIRGTILLEGQEICEGTIIKYLPNESAKLDCNGDTITFDLALYEFRFSSSLYKKPYIFDLPHDYQQVQLIMLPSLDGDNGLSIGYNFVKQISAHQGFGGSISFDAYKISRYYRFLNLHGVYRAFLNENNQSPFIEAFLGYGFSLGTSEFLLRESTGGITGAARLGYRFSAKRMMFSTFLGYRHQRGKYIYDSEPATTTRRIRFNRMEIGFSFMWR